MISSRSANDGVSLSISKSELIYSSLIFIDNKLTLICLLTEQQLVTVSAPLFNVSGEICIFEDKSARRMGCMTQSITLPGTSPDVHKFLKIFHQQIA